MTYIDYVDDYTIALSNYLSILNDTDLENDSANFVYEAIKKDAYATRKDVSTYLSILGTILDDTAEYARNINELEITFEKLAAFESEIARVNSFIEADGLLDSYLSMKTKASAEIISLNQKYASLMNAQEAQVTGKLSENIGKFTSKIPPRALKLTNKIASGYYYVTLVKDTAINVKDDVNALSVIRATDLQYEKAEALLDSIINNSSNVDLITAAKNIKKSMYDDYEMYLTKTGILIEDIAGGSGKIIKTYLVSQSGPVAWAIDAGVALGDALWHTSSVDQQSLATIALGDASVCFSKELSNQLLLDNSFYYNLKNDTFYDLA